MSVFFKKNKRLIIKGIIAIFFVLIIIIVSILKSNQNIAELWSRGFSRGYQIFFGYITKWIPFSIMEILALCLIIFCIVYLIKVFYRLFHKKWKGSLSSFLNIAVAILFVVSMYSITAEMSYNRKPVDIDLYEEKVEKTEFKKICQYFVDDLNECMSHLQFNDEGKITSMYSFNQMNDICEKEYKKLTSDYFTSFTTRVKPMVSSFIYREAHITGVTFAPTGEANANYLSSESCLPFTFLHELAHSKGVMRESDANLVAAYLALQSDDYFFRYSGYSYTIYSLMGLLDYTGVETDYKDVVNSINSKYFKNMSYEAQYWRNHNFFMDVSNWINDLYLKLSGVKEGVGSYDDTPIVVDPTKKEITSFSIYQKLYFEIYYS